MVPGRPDPARIAMLQRVIGELHSCSSTYVESILVTETFFGRRIWAGTIDVFALQGHTRAQKCYAWVKRHKRSRRVRFFAVVETTLIKTALDAVKCAHIAANARLIDEFSKLGEDRGPVAEQD